MLKNNRLFVLCSIFILFAFMIHANAADVVVDNDYGSPYFTYTGTWTLSSATGYNGGTYRYAYANTGATAKWTPDIVFGGTYNVYAYFIRGSNRTTSAPYKIHHAGGDTTVNIDQRGSSDQYYQLAEVLLGSWTFNSGSAGNITLLTNGAAGVYIADAIRFKLLEDKPPVISEVDYSPYYPAASEEISVNANVMDDVALKSVRLLWNAQPSGLSDDVRMFDDGLHDDDGTSDSIYAAKIPGLPAGENIEFYIQATDSIDQISSSTITLIEVGKTPDINLVLNELLASNVRGIKDPDFDNASDWIEIVNLGPDIADLHSFALSDDPTSPTRWRFPAEAFLNPGEYMVVWADGQNTVANAIHTDFKISASGESLVLYDMRNNKIADSVVFGSQISDVTYARIPDKTGGWLQTEKPTPGSANIYGKSGPMPIISVPSGIHTTSFQVDITTTSPKEIHYTLDGSAPELTSSLYTGSITISATSVLRARAWYTDLDPSPIASASYLFNLPSDRKIPIMNIVIDPDDFDGPNGIYTNYTDRGIDWEKACHISVFTVDGSQNYDVDAGVRLHGGYSRELDKKSLRFYFRSLYGPERWSLPWMQKSPVGSFQQLVLRSNANDSFLGGAIKPTYYRDQIMRDWYADLGQRAADGFFIALYINGDYWGLYNATERITDSFMEDSYGGEEWDVVKGSWDSVNKYFTEAVDGDLAGWNEFIEWVENHDVSKDADFQTLCSKMDIDNFLEHFALNIICQNHDWPHNNWISTRRRNDPAARWTFHEWDAEWSVGLRPTGWESDTLDWARGNNYYLQRQLAMPPLSLLFAGNHVDPNATKVINGLLDNPIGKRKFISYIEECLNFELLPANAIQDANFYEDLIQTEIAREAARWASSSGSSAQTLLANYNTGVSDAHNFLNGRPAYIRNLISDYFNLTGTETLTFTADGAGSGRLQVNGRIVNLPWSGVFFTDSIIALRPIPDTGSHFTSWGGLVQSTNYNLDYTIISTSPGQISLKFDPAPDDPKPNDVIFNEYWLNDNSTVYATIGNRAIDGDWIELLTITDKTDLRGWRITNNNTISEGGVNSTGGSLIFPNINALRSVPAGTFILIISKVSDLNAASFTADELDTTTKRLIFYTGNGNLDIITDPGFSITTGNEALILLAPGQSAEFSDDIGIDFIAEGGDVTPASFGVAVQNVFFTNPFNGIGGDDGAVFLNDPAGGFVNDDGNDANRDDFLPGPGGWVVDPPKIYSGDDTGTGSVNWLTPGARNHGQTPWPKLNTYGWMLY